MSQGQENLTIMTIDINLYCVTQSQLSNANDQSVLKKIVLQSNFWWVYCFVTLLSRTLGLVTLTVFQQYEEELTRSHSLHPNGA